MLQNDDDGHERVIAYQSRQLKAAELNYPVHDKELLAIKYALLKFRVYLLGAQPFVVYTDHASLRTAVNTPHLSQRMARWLSFFAEYNFRVEYKPGKQNVLADALSRRPDLEQGLPILEAAVSSMRCTDAGAELARVSVSSVRSSVRDDIKALYAQDEQCRLLISHFSGEIVSAPTTSCKAVAVLIP